MALATLLRRELADVAKGERQRCATADDRDADVLELRKTGGAVDTLEGIGENEEIKAFTTAGFFGSSSVSGPGQKRSTSLATRDFSASGTSATCFS